MLAGDLLNAQQYAVSMHRAELDRLEDEPLECALREVNLFCQSGFLAERGEYALSSPVKEREVHRVRQCHCGDLAKADIYCLLPKISQGVDVLPPSGITFSG